jgi:hypothetical protein
VALVIKGGDIECGDRTVVIIIFLLLILRLVIVVAGLHYTLVLSRCVAAVGTRLVRHEPTGDTS